VERKKWENYYDQDTKQRTTRTAGVLTRKGTLGEQILIDEKVKSIGDERCL